jgi:hypothetical protein
MAYYKDSLCCDAISVYFHVFTLVTSVSLQSVFGSESHLICCLVLNFKLGSLKVGIDWHSALQYCGSVLLLRYVLSQTDFTEYELILSHATRRLDDRSLLNISINFYECHRAAWSYEMLLSKNV